MKTSAAPRALWVDRLRSFITLLVIAHHAALAYTSFARFDPVAYILSTHPVVDSHRWPVLDIFVGFNDTFFMPLMFLISGMFTLTALRKKGASSFLTDRFRRLFIPFFIAVTLLMWIAYYPAWLLAGKPHSIFKYLVDFFTVEAWPVGPPWFIWVLFLFNAIIAFLYKPLELFFTKAASFVQSLSTRPLMTMVLLFVITFVLYAPADILFGTYTWTGIGPFDFQKSRLLLYFGYFLIGAIIGLTRFDEGLFSGTGVLVRRWPLWTVVSLASYVLLTFLPPGFPHLVIFTLTIALANIAFLTLFKAAANNRESPVWGSLGVHAYGMYLTHYIFIVWCQYALLDLDWPAGIKCMITFLFAAWGSWLFTAWLRRIPVIRKYL